MDSTTSKVHSTPWGEIVRDALVTGIEHGTIEIPPLPEIAVKVAEIANSEDADSAALAEVIHQDQALAANVLKIANSAAYAPIEPLVTLQHAIARLGFNALKNIVWGVAVRTRLFQINGYDKEARALWRHAILTAGLAREIARLRRKNVEGAFLCALLHDIGKPLILMEIARQKGKGIEAPSLDAVNQVLDELHTSAGFLLVTRWSLPPSVATTVQFHHDYTAAPARDEFASTTALADEIAERIAAGQEVTAEDLVAMPVMQVLNLYPDDIAALIASLEAVKVLAEAAS